MGTDGANLPIVPAHQFDLEVRHGVSSRLVRVPSTSSICPPGCNSSSSLPVVGIFDEVFEFSMRSGPETSRTNVKI